MKLHIFYCLLLAGSVAAEPTLSAAAEPAEHVAHLLPRSLMLGRAIRDTQPSHGHDIDLLALGFSDPESLKLADNLADGLIGVMNTIKEQTEKSADFLSVIGSLQGVFDNIASLRADVATGPSTAASIDPIAEPPYVATRAKGPFSWYFARPSAFEVPPPVGGPWNDDGSSVMSPVISGPEIGMPSLPAVLAPVLLPSIKLEPIEELSPVQQTLKESIQRLYQIMPSSQLPELINDVFDSAVSLVNRKIVIDIPHIGRITTRFDSVEDAISTLIRVLVFRSATPHSLLPLMLAN